MDSVRQKEGHHDGRWATICVAAVTTVVLLCLGCGPHSKKPVAEPQLEPVAVPAPSHPSAPAPSAAPAPSEPDTDVPNEGKEVEKVQEPPTAPISPVTLSRYYEEGYENGYDDGEDDAVSGNGWGGQYDDQCPYKGMNRKDYELGYEEGYEAGYDDNNEDDE